MLEGTSEASTKDSANEITAKDKRKNRRGNTTRCKKRLNEGVEKEDKNLRRVQKEMEQLRRLRYCARITQSVIRFARPR